MQVQSVVGQVFSLPPAIAFTFSLPADALYIVEDRPWVLGDYVLILHCGRYRFAYAGPNAFTTAWQDVPHGVATFCGAVRVLPGMALTARAVS